MDDASLLAQVGVHGTCVAVVECSSTPDSVTATAPGIVTTPASVTGSAPALTVVRIDATGAAVTVTTGVVVVASLVVGDETVVGATTDAGDATTDVGVVTIVDGVATTAVGIAIDVGAIIVDGVTTDAGTDVTIAVRDATTGVGTDAVVGPSIAIVTDVIDATGTDVPDVRTNVAIAEPSDDVQEEPSDAALRGAHTDVVLPVAPPVVPTDVPHVAVVDEAVVEVVVDANHVTRLS